MNTENAIPGFSSPKSLWLGFHTARFQQWCNPPAHPNGTQLDLCRFLVSSLDFFFFYSETGFPDQPNLENRMMGLLSTSKNLSGKTALPGKQSKLPALTPNFTSLIRNHKEIGSYEKHGTVLWKDLIVICLHGTKNNMCKWDNTYF